MFGLNSTGESSQGAGAVALLISHNPNLISISNRSGVHTQDVMDFWRPNYTNNAIADDPAQHKQSHVIELIDAGSYTGNIVALPNNRVRATNPALWRVGEGPPDFSPSQWIHSAEKHDSYMDSNVTFDNLYNNKYIIN
mgnify:CR=1 FL=1